MYLQDSNALYKTVIAYVSLSYFIYLDYYKLIDYNFDTFIIERQNVLFTYVRFFIFNVYGITEKD